MTVSAIPASDRNATPLLLRAVRGFHVGGEITELRDLPVSSLAAVPGGPARTSDPNGHYLVGQLYAQSFELVAPRFTCPLLLWHGGGLTGACWEDTPDGRPGWHDRFMRAGWDTVVSDAPERGRAGWARYPEIVPDVPEHRTLEAAWGMFRVGPPGGFHADPAQQETFPGQLFPVEAFEQLGRQFVARWASGGALARRAYAALLTRTGPAVVVAHSQGAVLAQQVALDLPELIQALVLVEPAGAPGDNPAEAAPIPTLVVWGDHFADSPLWRDSYRPEAERWLEARRAAGHPVTVLDLPAEGVRGNSHMPMMDRNSDAVAARVQAWLERLDLG